MVSYRRYVTKKLFTIIQNTNVYIMFIIVQYEQATQSQVQLKRFTNVCFELLKTLPLIIN